MATDSFDDLVERATRRHNRLATFLYLLMRDKLNTGAVESLMDAVRRLGDKDPDYTSEHLAAYAECLAEEIINHRACPSCDTQRFGNGKPVWVQCTTKTNTCLGGCTKEEHEAYVAKPAKPFDPTDKADYARPDGTVDAYSERLATHMNELCGHKVPNPPDVYADCTRLAGHQGPCAHPLKHASGKRCWCGELNCPALDINST